MKLLHAASLLASLLIASGCDDAGNEGAGGAGGADARYFDSPPAPMDDGALCMLSIDCAEGQHCDLGECVQDCNTEDPCNDEDLRCSPRARCVATAEEDRDEVDPSVSQGVLTVTPSNPDLLESATELRLELKATGDQVVKYRALVQGDFLSIAQPRGEFEGTTELVVAVDSSKADGDGIGYVKLMSSLGEVSVPVVLKKGLTGKYHGNMRYEVNGVSLGNARLAVDIIEQNGELSVRVDPDSSLLFPEGSAGPTTGVGTYDEAAGAEFTVQQHIDSELGGARNHFVRALGRRLTFKLERSSLGGFDGTFNERIFGLLDVPVDLEGTVFLSRRTDEDRPDFTLSADSQIPPFVAPPLADVTGAFGSSQTCAQVMTATAGSGFDIATSGTRTSVRAMSGLRATLASRTANALTFAEVRADCESEVHLATKPTAVSCAWQPALVCATSYASGAIGSGTTNSGAFLEFFVSALEPTVLVAQDYAVKALNDSFGLSGLTKERGSYEAAAEQLGPSLAWALHPAIAGYLSGLDVEVVRGAEPAAGDDSTTSQTFSAARAFARLLQIAGAVDGELSRLAAVDALASDTNLVKEAQARAVLGLMESAILIQMTRSWGITPDLLGADLTGFLTPLDGGFGALVEGARSFGVPDGYVPFVWRPEDTGAGATNFEQMLNLALKSRVALASLEAAYVQNNRTFEENESAMLREALDLSATYDSQIAQLCGSDFDIEAVEGLSDFSRCGAGGSGEVGSALLSIARSDQRIAEHQSRIQGLIDKYAVTENALKASQEARGKNIAFLDRTGQAINGLELAIGGMDLAMECIANASQSGLLNFGGPAAGAAAMAVIGANKLGAESVRNQLALTQQLAAPKLDKELALIEGMAELKRQLIDIAQAQLEMTSFALEKQDAALGAANLAERAQQLYQLRKRALSVAELDPTRDPAYRLIRDSLALQVLDSRARSQKLLFLAGRALEYEVNTPIPSLPSAVLAARSSLGMEQLAACFEEVNSSFRIAYGVPQSYTTEISVRELLGVLAERTDEVTGEVLDPGQQFRLLTQKNQNFDEDGGLTITFGTNLQPNNGLWSEDVCADRITRIQAQLVGDNLGDDEAQVNINLSGAALLRECDSDSLQSWSMSEGTSGGSATAVIQAGVNSFGASEANSSLFGQSVARATWTVSVPGPGGAPSNDDISIDGLEDIILRIEHEASPRRTSALFVDLSCLSSIN